MALDAEQQGQLNLLRRAHDLVEAVTSKEGDASVSPTNLLDRVPAEFVALKALLGTGQFGQLAHEFQSEDKIANRWQARFRWAERTRIVLFFAALCLGAYALSPWSASGGAASGGVAGTGVELERAISLAQGIAIVLALVVISLSIGVDSYGKWRKARANAEYAKGRYFSQVAQAGEAAGEAGAIPLSLQKLEIMRRYRLQHQHAYLAKKVTSHESSERRRRLLLYIAATLAFLVALPMIADLLAALGYPALGDFISGKVAAVFGPQAMLAQYFLALGAIAAGFEAAIENYFRIEQDLRFAAHFRGTGRELEALANKLPPVRRAAAAGDEQPVTQWLEELEQILFKEHERWLQAHLGEGDALAETRRLDPPIG